MPIVRYRFGDYVLDLPKHELLHRGAAVALQARVFECLCCLVEHRDRAVGRDELVRAVFNRADVSDAQLAQVVLRSRRAVGDDGQAQHSIRTVPRFGFRWLPPVVAEDADATTRPRPAGEARRAAPDDAAADAEPAEAVAADVPAEPVVPARTMPAASGIPAMPASPAATAPHASRRRVAVLVPLAALALAGVLALVALPRLRDAAPTPGAADAQPAALAVAVLPTTLRDGDDASWARLGLMDYIGDRLRRGGLPVLPSEATLGILHGRGDDPRRLREAARAKWIVDSRASRDERGWHVQLEAGAASGPATRADARDPDLLRAARLASDRLAVALGGRAAPGDAPDLAERLQRARAAMLGNRIEAARRILLDAPELQRAQPLLRYQLARVDFRAGDHARGLAALDDLLAHDAARGDARFQAQLLNARGAILLRLGRAEDATRSYDAALAAIGAAVQPAELGVALSGRAVANALRQRFDRALADFGRARVQLAAAGDATAVARVDANLGILEVDRGHPAQALPALERAIHDFDAMGATNELSTLRNMRVAALLQLLRRDEALAESERALALLPQLRDPAQRADTVLTRAQALLEAGRLREAAQALAMPEARRSQPTESGRREALQAELALRGGAPARAVAIADAALRSWPADRNPQVRAWLRLRREQAALQAELAVSAGTDALGDTVPDRLTRATALRARGEVAAADAAYASALALAGERGVPAEVAAVVVAHAGWLLDRGDTTGASALVGRAAPWAAQDFDLAALQTRLLATLGQDAASRAAHARVVRLAGERTLPAPVAAAPGAEADHRDAE